MTEYESRGIEIRHLSKSLVLQFMQATSSNQQYWIVALVRELEAEHKVERVSESGPWSLL